MALHSEPLLLYAKLLNYFHWPFLKLSYVLILNFADFWFWVSRIFDFEFRGFMFYCSLPFVVWLTLDSQAKSCALPCSARLRVFLLFWLNPSRISFLFYELLFQFYCFEIRYIELLFFQNHVKRRIDCLIRFWISYKSISATKFSTMSSPPKSAALKAWKKGKPEVSIEWLDVTIDIKVWKIIHRYKLLYGILCSFIIFICIFMISSRMGLKRNWVHLIINFHWIMRTSIITNLLPHFYLAPLYDHLIFILDLIYWSFQPWCQPYLNWSNSRAVKPAACFAYADLIDPDIK